MLKKANQISVRAYFWAQAFIKDQRGELGVGQLAAMVAAVVIIGSITMVVSDNVGEWIGEIWTRINALFEQIGNAELS